MSKNNPQQDSAANHGHGADGVEPDHPPVGSVFVLLALITIGLSVMGVTLWQVFKMTARQETVDRDLAVPNQELVELRARDQGMLARYDLIDSDAGVYQIPVERAMKALAANPQLLAPIAAPATGAGNAAQADGGSAESGADAEVDAQRGEAGGGIDAGSAAPAATDASER